MEEIKKLSSLPSDELKIGDVIQISGDTVPQSMRNAAYWRVENITDGRIDLSPPFSDANLTTLWFSDPRRRK